MKILFINTLSESYGSTVRCRLMVKCLRELDHHVLYCEARPSSLHDELLLDQSDSLAGYSSATSARLKLIRADRNYDLIFISKLNPLTLPLIWKSLRNRIPLIVDWDDLDSWFQTTVSRRFVTRVVEKMTPRFVPIITTHNQALKEYARQRGCGKVFILPQVVDTELFNPHNYDRNAEKERTGVPRDRPCAGIALTFTQGGGRDLDTVLQAFAQLEAANVPLSLMLIGDGPHKALYEHKAEQLGLRNINWRGWQPYTNIPADLAACDLGLVFMSEDAGNRYRFSLKMLEYLAMNIPVLGRATGATQSQLGHLIHSVNQPSAAALATELKQWYESVISGSGTDTLARPATRDFIMAHHSLTALKSGLEQVLSHIIKE